MFTRPVIAAFIAGILASSVGGSLGLMAAASTNAERTERLFVYGTLTNPIARTYACRCFVTAEAATLANYIKTESRNIQPFSSGTVSGKVITVSEAELDRIDTYESVPTEYTRGRVMVGNTPAWVYIKNKR